MSSMMRLKDDKALQEMLRTSHLREAGKAVPQKVTAAPKRAAAPAGPPARSELELRLEQQMRLLKLPTPETDYWFIFDRGFRFDFCWPHRKVAVECEGMAHRTKGRFKADIEKYGLALLDGWKVLRVSGDEVRSGRAIRWAVQLLHHHSSGEPADNQAIAEAWQTIVEQEAKK